MTYGQHIKALLSPAERRVFSKLNSPQKIQDFLDHSPVNFELKGETICSPRRILKEKRMHCAEGALFAAAALAYHGYPPLLMDFQTMPVDEDHVLAVFKQNGLWGAISKTNHSVLRWRDPIYKSPRELAMSYAHEYYLWSGKKSLRAYSEPFDLRKFKPEWVVAEMDLDPLIEALDDSPHVAITPKGVRLRPASPIELLIMRQVEWKDPRKKRRG